MCYQITQFPRAETDLLIVLRSADTGRRNLLQGLGWLMLKYVHGEGCEVFGKGIYMPLYVCSCVCVSVDIICIYVLMCLNTWLTSFSCSVFFFHSSGCVTE